MRAPRRASLLALIFTCLLVSGARAHASPELVLPRPMLVENTDPTLCGLTTAQYGTLGVGSVVTLGRHTPWTGPTGDPSAPFTTADDNWTPEMDAYVGRRATVVELSGLDNAGCAGVRVDIDSQEWFWRIRDLVRASSGTLRN